MTLASVAIGLNRMRRRRTPGFDLCPLVFLTDGERAPDPAGIVASWATPLARATMVIFRHYDHPDRAEIGTRLARVCHARGIPLLVAGDPKLMKALRAAGIHWPDGLMRRRGTETRAAGRHITTAAAHDARGLRRASLAGVDAIFLSPVFPTSSHAERTPLGRLRFAALVRSVRVPVYALGGMDDRTAQSLIGSGAAGLAAIGALRNPEPSR